MTLLVETACPGCKQLLKVPTSYVGQTLRCKNCGQTIRLKEHLPASAAAPSGTPSDSPSRRASPPQATSPAGIPSAVPEVLDFGPAFPAMPAEPHVEHMHSYLERKQRRQRRMAIICLSTALAVLLAVGASAVVFHKSIAHLFSGPREPPDDDLVAAPGSTRLTPTLPTTAVAIPTETRPATKPPPFETPPLPPATRPGPPTTRPSGPRLPSRFAAPYKDAARALIIGVRGYQNLPVINAAYTSNDPANADPLGVNALARTLVKDLGFRPEAVGLLSDTAQVGPIPPRREEIKLNLERFLRECRPQDRALIAFVGQVQVIDGQGCLVPLDGELDKKETLLPISWLYEQLKGCPARQKLLILDVAHAVPNKPQDFKLPEAFVKQLEAELPKDQGIQVWLSCSAGEHSQGFEDGMHAGSVFMFFLVNSCSLLSNPSDWERLRERRDIVEGKIPLAGFRELINSEMSEYLKARGAVQAAFMFGEEKAEPGKFAVGPLAAVALERAPAADPPADARLIAAILAEMKLARAPAMPVFSARTLENYQPDYKTDAELHEILKKNAFRRAVVQANEYLAKPLPNLLLQFRYPGNDMVFKNQLEPIRKRNADLKHDIDEALKLLLDQAENRKDEPPRWQAHYDLALVRLLTRAAQIDDYSHIIANKLYKDAPVPTPPNTGFRITPSITPTSRNGKSQVSERQKILARLEKEHGKTPWAFIGKQEAAQNSGFELSESR